MEWYLPGRHPFQEKFLSLSGSVNDPDTVNTVQAGLAASGIKAE